MQSSTRRRSERKVFRGHWKTIAEAFGRVLRRLRVAVAAQATFAKAANINPTFLSELERGRAQPSLAVFLRISKALGIHPGRLIKLVEVELTQGTTQENQAIEARRRYDGARIRSPPTCCAEQRAKRAFPQSRS